MVQVYEDVQEFAAYCECSATGDVLNFQCVCEEGCECACLECGCNDDWDEMRNLVTGGCGCGGNCACNQSEDEPNEGGL